MTDQRVNIGSRTFFGGKLVFNGGQSVIDCIVRHLSADGACIQVDCGLGIPSDVNLLIAGDNSKRPSHVAWRSENRIGLSFDQEERRHSDAEPNNSQSTTPIEIVRSEMSALRAALDEVGFGVVLLDNELRAQFINRMFRKMWRLPDHKADCAPAFVALMYHGRDTRAYQIAEEDLDAYVAERVASVKAGDTSPRDLRLSNGEVIRFNCATLPNGGRMLSYTYVTDIVRRSDELATLKDALNRSQEGIVLLDAELNAQFMNVAVRDLWRIPDDLADSRPHYRRLVGDSRFTGTYGVAPDQLEAFIAQRVALVQSGDPAPHDLKISDGRHIRSQCTMLSNGSRMLTYCDVSDLFDHAKQLERLATIDSMTGVYNRRQFLALAEAEWVRFQRYHRPLALLMVDIDHFKSVNDQFGHAAGDTALTAVAHACQGDRRASDIVGRIGGEEFAVILPEVDADQALIVAERIRIAVTQCCAGTSNNDERLTVSIGVVEASLSMSSVAALMKAADDALYLAKTGGRNCVRQSRPPAVDVKIAAK